MDLEGLTLLAMNLTGGNLSGWDVALLAGLEGGGGGGQLQLKFYLMGVAGLVVCALGVLANALSGAVLTRPPMRSSTYLYLAALAVSDTLVLLLTAFLLAKDAQPLHALNSQALEPAYSRLFPVLHPLALLFQLTSIWLTLAFTVDRYIMICHPFQAQRLCTRTGAKRVVVGLFFGALLFDLPRFLEYRTCEERLSLNNTTQMFFSISFTAVGESPVFKAVVHSWLYLIFVCGLPFLTLSVLNAFLMHAVVQSRKKGREINACQRRRNDTTVMLISVVVMFLICQGPALVSRMIFAFYPLQMLPARYHAFSEVANFLVVLNSAINIVPYYFFGKKFRKEFWRLFCKCLFDKEDLRKMTRALSFSVDPQQKHAVVSFGLLRRFSRSPTREGRRSKEGLSPTHTGSAAEKRVDSSNPSPVSSRLLAPGQTSPGHDGSGGGGPHYHRLSVESCGGASVGSPSDLLLPHPGVAAPSDEGRTARPGEAAAATEARRGEGVLETVVVLPQGSAGGCGGGDGEAVCVLAPCVTDVPTAAGRSVGDSV